MTRTRRPTPLQPESGSSTLRPRARILRTIGDELISSEAVALIELIKNAYDADARNVLVLFEGDLVIGQGKVEVMDDGHGMSFETVQSAWMEPATTHRKRNSFSEQLKRRVLGAKGIGRFAAARLADYLHLVTRRATAPTQVRAVFDWSQFDDDSKYLDEVTVLWELEPASDISSDGRLALLWQIQGVQHPQGQSHGTILAMERLRANWDRSKLQDLRSKLSRLISPFPIANHKIADSFDIWLQVPEPYSELSGRVEPSEAIRNPHYTLDGNVEQDGSYSLRLNIRNGEHLTVTGKFRLNRPASDGCGPFFIQLRVWDRDQESLSTLAQITDVTVTNLRRDLDVAAGISVYRDGFRVLPYGEPQNDWLRLDIRRVQNPSLRLSNNQVLGYVLVSSEGNPDLRDQSNREGLIEGPALEDLREKIVMVLAELEIRRFAARRELDKQRSGQSRNQGLFSGFNLDLVKNHVSLRYPGDQELQNLLQDTQRDLDTRIGTVQSALARYRRLATLGQLIDIVLHDGRTPLAKILNEIDSAQLDLRSRRLSPQAAIDSLKKRFDIIVMESAVLRTLFQRIEPFGGRQRGRATTLILEEIIKNTFLVLETERSRLGVVTLFSDGVTRIIGDASELQEVVINLLQNSLYWLEQVPRGQREILVTVTRLSDDEAEIVFSDSGPGVPVEFQEQIFDPYFSTKPNGIGLGLAIVGEIVTDYYSGRLELLSSGPLTGANFRVVLGKRG